MQVGRTPAGRIVPLPDLPIRRPQQCPRPAGQIRQPQPGHRARIRPVRQVDARHRQPRQQLRRLRQSIVRGRFLPVVQQFRKKFSGKVHLIAQPQRRDTVRHPRQLLHNTDALLHRNAVIQRRPRRIKYGAIVDRKDFVPFRPQSGQRQRTKVGGTQLGDVLQTGIPQ